VHTLRTHTRTLLQYPLLCCLLLLGCTAETPGTWKQPKVEAEMTRKLELQQITLTPSASGFEGSGTAQDGETYKLKITQDPNKGRLDWTATGDRGSSEEGSWTLE
jgi:hypothetical protein